MGCRLVIYFIQTAMMKMRHVDTGEIVCVEGFYSKPDGTVYARCLCDPRLHPEKGEHPLEKGSVMKQLKADHLTSLETVDWDDVASLYADGKFDQLRNRAKKNYEDSIWGSIKVIYPLEVKQSIQKGMNCDDARNAALERCRAHVAKHLGEAAADMARISECAEGGGKNGKNEATAVCATMGNAVDPDAPPKLETLPKDGGKPRRPTKW